MITRELALVNIGKLPDGARLCPECYSPLKGVMGNGGSYLYCPNEMCLDQTHWKLDIHEEIIRQP